MCVLKKNMRSRKAWGVDDFAVVLLPWIAHRWYEKKCKFNLHFVTCPICSRYAESPQRMCGWKQNSVTASRTVNSLPMENRFFIWCVYNGKWILYIYRQYFKFEKIESTLWDFLFFFVEKSSSILSLKVFWNIFATATSLLIDTFRSKYILCLSYTFLCLLFSHFILVIRIEQSHDRWKWNK